MSLLTLVGHFFFKPTTPTPELVKDYWRFLTEHYKVEVIQKGDRRFMRTIGDVLDLMGILDSDYFMNNFATTIGGKIFIPFEIGKQNPDGRWSLWSQIEVLPHEVTHTVQSRRSGELLFDWEYLTDPAARARLEAEALTCNMETVWRYRRHMVDPYLLASGLRHYNCSPTDIDVAAKTLRMRAAMIKKNAILSEVGKVAYPWLDQRMNH